VTPEDQLVALARLSLPAAVSFVPELGASALLRELHVYGEVAALGEGGGGRAQHGGLGRRLVQAAAARAAAAGHDALAVISAVGTRRYYHGLGFADGALYQHRPLAPRLSSS
jgi:elongator complex protein 3